MPRCERPGDITREVVCGHGRRHALWSSGSAHTQSLASSQGNGGPNTTCHARIPIITPSRCGHLRSGRKERRTDPQAQGRAPRPARGSHGGRERRVGLQARRPRGEWGAEHEHRGDEPVACFAGAEAAGGEQMRDALACRSMSVEPHIPNERAGGRQGLLARPFVSKAFPTRTACVRPAFAAGDHSDEGG